MTATRLKVSHRQRFQGAVSSIPAVITASSITANGAVITWTTNKPSDSQADYGTTPTYGSSTTLDPTQVTSHSRSLANLTAGTTYNYRIRSKDAGGSVTVSSNFTFTTQQGTDTTPPGDVTNFTAVPGNTVVNLNWTNPTDSDYKGVMIRYRTDGTYPTSNTDGMLAMDRTEVAGSNDYFVHSGFRMGPLTVIRHSRTTPQGIISHTAHTQATPANVSISSLSPTNGLVWGQSCHFRHWVRQYSGDQYSDVLWIECHRQRLERHFIYCYCSSEC